MSTFEDNDFQIQHAADHTKNLLFDVGDIATGTNVTMHLSPPSSSVPSVEALVTDRSTGIVINQNVTFDENGGLFVNNSGNGTVVTVLAPLFGSTTTNAIYPSVSGVLVPSVSTTDAARGEYIGQTANIGSTNLIVAPPAGQYRITAYLETTAIGVGTNIVTFAWTDNVGATTDASTVLALTGTGRTSKTINAYVASGNISFSTSGYTSGTFALHIRIEAL